MDVGEIEMIRTFLQTILRELDGSITSRYVRYLLALNHTDRGRLRARRPQSPESGAGDYTLKGLAEQQLRAALTDLVSTVDKSENPGES